MYIDSIIVSESISIEFDNNLGEKNEKNKILISPSVCFLNWGRNGHKDEYNGRM